MGRNSLVSVIMIFLNEEQFIQEAIASVFAQSYGNWELLLVDDGSTDGSSKIVQRYAEQYPEKVRYVEHDGHQNRGMSASRNLGIRNARGEYIAFLDGDDVWLPRKLEQQVAILESQPEAALVCGRAQWWYSWTGKPEDNHRDFIQQLDVQLDTLVKPPTLLSLFLQNEWASLCDILVRREVVEAVGGYEDSFRGMYEDQAFHAKLCLKSAVFVANACWYRYRQHSDACTVLSHRAGQYYVARQTFLNWLEEYLSKQGMADTEVWKVLHIERRRLHHPRLSRISVPVQRFLPLIKDRVEQIGLKTLPVSARHWLRAQWQAYRRWPPLGWVRFGHLRRVTPFSRQFGFDHGLPIDRYYIEDFLARHADDIRGHVLEVSNATYTRRFGGDRVGQSDVLHVSAGNPMATIVADLTCAEQIPSATFDCLILTQTLPFVYDVRAVIKTLYRILKPGGVVLVTVPGISQVSREDMEQWGQYWSFTTQSVRRLFEEIFPGGQVHIKAYGNVLTATAFLYGLVTQDLRRPELDYHDPDYEMIITVRAVRPRVALC
jgi:glycosyltransferase involved in cell wall biosynthesis/SAM-dependent methyltransferase